VSWGLLVVAAAVFAFALLSRRLAATVVSAAMVFIAVGVVTGPSGLGWLDLHAHSETVRRLAEATLTFVLFADASRIDLRALRREWGFPARLLGIGLPLTILAGTLAALPLLTTLTVMQAVVLAVVLAPTDAALGQAVVTDERIPRRVRQALNVESGLNDGICVPLLFIALAVVAAQAGAETDAHALRTVVEQIGYGVLAGVGVGLAGAVLMAGALARGLADELWVRVGVAAIAVATYALAVPLGGSGFIAAFVGGAVYGGATRRTHVADDLAEHVSLVEELGAVLSAATFVVFGAAILGPALGHIGADAWLYALLSLTVVRMVPVAVSLLGSGARARTVGFLGWFGPRGLASIVFAVIVVDDGSIPHPQPIVAAVVATIVLSVVAHGMTAVPGAKWYARWYQDHPERPELTESAAVTHQHWRRRWMRTTHE
jgi:NhaP-type Na+/H+ or K+/H+ antiporter